VMLADLGADVIKVEERVGGDPGRGILRAQGLDLTDRPNFYFEANNRNKRSITVDLKKPRQLADLRRLCIAADVIVENFRAGVLARLGLGYASLSASAPGLVYCSVSGYGQTGPYAKKGAFDVVVQAMSGVMSVTGNEDAAPAKCGVPIGDFAAGLYAAYSIVAALFERDRTHRGCNIDCSMLGSLLGIAALQTSEYFGTGVPATRIGSAHPRNAPYQAFEGSDKPFVIAAGNDKLWWEVCDAVGMPELKQDERFRVQAMRAKNQRQLAPILQRVFSTRSAEYWLGEFDRRGVPCGPINNFAEILSDPHVEHMGWVRDLTLPNGVDTKTVGFPIGISGHPLRIFRPPPELGEHNQEVVNDWLGTAA